ncbi:MAG: HDOD domain-containing protein [Solirubrobacterales bacterium]
MALAKTETIARTNGLPTEVPGNQAEGHGRRLTQAFEALEQFPALAESRDRVLRVVSEESVSIGDVVAAVESDVALMVAVMRIANRRGNGKVTGIPQAVEILTTTGIEALASATKTYDFFERTPIWDAQPERFRLHAVATQRAADRIAEELNHPDRDELMVSAMLHDIGKLVLSFAYQGYPLQVIGNARTPEDRLQAERRELGVDHAMVGGVLARRWGLPSSIASAIERHHTDKIEGEVAIVRLADMLAHYAQGRPVSPDKMLAAARVCGLGPAELRSVLFDMPFPPSGRPRATEPCPLSKREMDVLRLLAHGKVYKQIAQEMTLSTSTVRTHLHNIYGKLGAVDRAQAVLIATERGWL